MAEKYLLLRNQSNQVHQIINSVGLDPGAFRWEEQLEERIPMTAEAGYISVLRHRGSGYCFEFDLRRRRYWAAFSPGRDTPRESVEASDWPKMLTLVGVWATYLRMEIEAPDLWSTAASASEFAGAVVVDDAVFTDEERVNAQRGVEAVRQRLLDSGDLQEHTHLITEQLDYLKGAIDRMSRRDWRNTAIGVVFTIVAACILSPQVARDLFQLIGDAFRRVFRLSS